jgi:hypothetical protein
MTEPEYHTVVLVKHDDDGDAYIDFIRKLKSVDLETAIKNAVKEYITTPEGMEHAESEFGYFNYGDASEIPAEITRNHGMSVSLTLSLSAFTLIITNTCSPTTTKSITRVNHEDSHRICLEQFQQFVHLRNCGRMHLGGICRPARQRW